MTITEPSERQIQETCPDFCERTEHVNMDTPESPVIVHSSGEHNVHGVLVQVGVATDDRGVEVDDDALTVWIDQHQQSVQEARDVGNAILAAVTQAELSIPRVKRALEQRGVVDGFILQVGADARLDNQQKHDRLRAARGAATS